jgi:hypothetical protein
MLEHQLYLHAVSVILPEAFGNQDDWVSIGNPLYHFIVPKLLATTPVVSFTTFSVFP